MQATATAAGRARTLRRKIEVKPLPREDTPAVFAFQLSETVSCAWKTTPEVEPQQRQVDPAQIS
jgi:hypothetical protein